MSKNLRAPGSIIAIISLAVYICGVLYMAVLVGGLSGHVIYVPLTLFIALAPVAVGMVVLKKNGGQIPAPAFVQQRQNKVIMALVLVYAAMALIVGLTRGFK